jgi:Amt family ammonium transporter
VFDFGVAMNGALAGLVGITASCAFVEMWAAIVIGTTAGLVYVWASRFVLHTLRIDDPLDATPVHFFCGMWGLLCAGAFANPLHLGFFLGDPTNVRGGFLYPGAGGDLLAGQIVEILVIVAWTAGFMTPLFYVLNQAGVLRVPPDVEEEGLDASTHGGGAYPDMFHASEFVNEKKATYQPPAQQTNAAAAAPAVGEVKTLNSA